MTQSLDSSRVLWDELVPGGAHWSGVMRRGTTLRLTDVNGGANVAMLLYNWEDRGERYNMADTLKGQHTAFLTTGNVCYSDMGRVMCSITSDSCGWHDTIGGVSNAKMVKVKYGEARYQEHRNAYHRNGYDSLINELGKYGLGRRDLVSNLNLFSKIVVSDAGDMQFVPNNSKAGSHIDLRFEMDCLVALSTCQHPLDPNPAYAPQDVNLTAWRSEKPGPDDACRNHCEQNQRAFINTERLYPLG
ncbi:MAG: urea carboxylase-associated family protein [Chromatiales bacterium]|nr:urea carboxylase-associated family protein [Chromatiales bacterium]